jgi:hypothetical protein
VQTNILEEGGKLYRNNLKKISFIAYCSTSLWWRHHLSYTRYWNVDKSFLWRKDNMNERTCCVGKNNSNQKFTLNRQCKSLLEIRSGFTSRQSTYKQVDVTRVSTVSFTQAAFRKFYGRYNDLICPYNLSLGHMLSDMFHTNQSAVLDTLIFTVVRSVYLTWKNENRAHGECDRSNGMLTPPWHLIPPLIYSEVCVRPFSNLYLL